MFTGMIETFVPVKKRTESSLVVQNPFKEDLTIGQSIACNGACLSVVHFTKGEIEFDVLSETFRCTNLGSALFVNLERAMLAGGRFEGHIVLGHIDEMVFFLKKKEEESGVEFLFSLPKSMQYIVRKGSISLNGVSLTVGNITNKTFSVFLIPLTLEHTNLSRLQEGDEVSLEYDYLGKLVLSKSF